MISDTPISIIIPVQNTNHVVDVVVSLRNLYVRKPVPNQKTRFDTVSAFLLNGERATNLSAKMKIWKRPHAKLNCVTAE